MPTIASFLGSYFLNISLFVMYAFSSASTNINYSSKIMFLHSLFLYIMIASIMHARCLPDECVLCSIMFTICFGFAF